MQAPEFNRSRFMLSSITVQTSSIFSAITKSFLKCFKILYWPGDTFNYKKTPGKNSTSLSFMYIMVVILVHFFFFLARTWTQLIHMRSTWYKWGPQYPSSVSHIWSCNIVNCHHLIKVMIFLAFIKGRVYITLLHNCWDLTTLFSVAEVYLRYNEDRFSWTLSR